MQVYAPPGGVVQPFHGLLAQQNILFFPVLMKRILLLVSSGLLLASSAQAQLGVRAGGNAAGFTIGNGPGSDRTAMSRGLGYQVGVFYQLPLAAHLSLVPELQFSREHFEAKYARAADGQIYFEGPPYSHYNQSLSYLSLPLLLRATVGVFYLEAGPQVSLLVGGRTENIITSTSSINSQVFEQAQATSSYHRFDAGPCVGVGVKLPAGLGLGIRAYWGLTKLTAAEDYSASSVLYTGFQHRQTLQASLTYQLAAR